MAGLKGQALPEGQLGLLPALLPQGLFAAEIPVVGVLGRVRATVVTVALLQCLPWW